MHDAAAQEAATKTNKVSKNISSNSNKSVKNATHPHCHHHNANVNRHHDYIRY
jgi:hypothetical protein